MNWLDNDLKLAKQAVDRLGEWAVRKNDTASHRINIESTVRYIKSYMEELVETIELEEINE